MIQVTGRPIVGAREAQQRQRGARTTQNLQREPEPGLIAATKVRQPCQLSTVNWLAFCSPTNTVRPFKQSCSNPCN